MHQLQALARFARGVFSYPPSRSSGAWRGGEENGEGICLPERIASLRSAILLGGASSPSPARFARGKEKAGMRIASLRSAILLGEHQPQALLAELVGLSPSAFAQAALGSGERERRGYLSTREDCLPSVGFPHWGELQPQALARCARGAFSSPPSRSSCAWLRGGMRKPRRLRRQGLGLVGVRGFEPPASTSRT